MNTPDTAAVANSSSTSTELKESINLTLAAVIEKLNWLAENYPHLMEDREEGPSKIKIVLSKYRSTLSKGLNNTTYSMLRGDNNPIKALKEKKIKEKIQQNKGADRQLSDNYEELIEGLENLKALTDQLPQPPIVRALESN